MDLYILPNVNYIASGKQHSTEISSVLCVHLEGWDRERGRETQEGGDKGDICICIADSLCYKAETNTPLQSNYTPIKMLKKNSLDEVMLANQTATIRQVIPGDKSSY